MPSVVKPYLLNAALRLLAACAMTLALAAPAWAQMGRDQAAAAAERQTGGRVLAVERIESGSGPVWRVKVITPRGEVRIVLIAADDAGGTGAAARSNHRPGRGG